MYQDKDKVQRIRIPCDALKFTKIHQNTTPPSLRLQIPKPKAKLNLKVEIESLT